MAKKLVQYGGYLLSAILIAWLINPIFAINSIEMLMKAGIVFFVPFTGVKLLNRIIELRHKKAWNYSVFIWLIASVYFCHILIKTIQKLF